MQSNVIDFDTGINDIITVSPLLDTGFLEATTKKKGFYIVTAPNLATRWPPYLKTVTKTPQVSHSAFLQAPPRPIYYTTPSPVHQNIFSNTVSNGPFKKFPSSSTFGPVNTVMKYYYSSPRPPYTVNYKIPHMYNSLRAPKYMNYKNNETQKPTMFSHVQPPSVITSYSNVKTNSNLTNWQPVLKYYTKGPYTTTTEKDFYFTEPANTKPEKLTFTRPIQRPSTYYLSKTTSKPFVVVKSLPNNGLNLHFNQFRRTSRKPYDLTTLPQIFVSSIPPPKYHKVETNRVRAPKISHFLPTLRPYATPQPRISTTQGIPVGSQSPNLVHISNIKAFPVYQKSTSITDKEKKIQFPESNGIPGHKVVKVYKAGNPYLRVSQLDRKDDGVLKVFPSKIDDFMEASGSETRADFLHDVVIFSTENPYPIMKFGYSFKVSGTVYTGDMT